VAYSSEWSKEIETIRGGYYGDVFIFLLKSLKIYPAEIKPEGHTGDPSDVAISAPLVVTRA
jgi:hypothetical protein